MRNCSGRAFLESAFGDVVSIVLALALRKTRGLAAAVLAELLVQQAAPGAQALQAIVYAMIFFGMVFTSILVFVVNQPLGGRAMAWLLGRGQETAPKVALGA